MILVPCDIDLRPDKTLASLRSLGPKTFFYVLNNYTKNVGSYETFYSKTILVNSASSFPCYSSLLRKHKYLKCMHMYLHCVVILNN